MSHSREIQLSVLEQVESCSSVNTEPFELLSLQPNELIASESAWHLMGFWNEPVTLIATLIKQELFSKENTFL